MASFIIVGLILSILSGAASWPVPFEDERSIATVNAAINKVCNREVVRNFIQCEVTPRVSQGDSFNPQAVRVAFGYSGGVIFATATPIPLDYHLSDLGLIWKVTATFRNATGTYEARIPVHKEIRVAVKFHFDKDLLQNDKHHREEQQNLQTLNGFGLAPARYVFENEDGPILTKFIIMERIDGITLFEYFQTTEIIQELDEYNSDTKKRLPGLRLLYIHLETMLLLERLQIAHKWRHCDLHWKNVMIRKSTKERIHCLQERLRKNEQENDQMEKDDREAWIALQMEARLVKIRQGGKTAVYQTSSNHMVFVGTANARQVDPMRENDAAYFVCPSLPDISLIFMLWRLERPKDEKNTHLARMRQALQEIFAPLIEGSVFSALEEVIVLKQVIKQLRALEEEEKEAFIIARLKGSREGRRGIQTAPDLPSEQEVPQLQPIQRRRAAEGRAEMRSMPTPFPRRKLEPQKAQLEPQHRASAKATRTDRLAAASSKARALSQRTVFRQALQPPSADNVPPVSRAPSFVSYRRSPAIKRGIPRKTSDSTSSLAPSQPASSSLDTLSEERPAKQVVSLTKQPDQPQQQRRQQPQHQGQARSLHQQTSFTQASPRPSADNVPHVSQAPIIVLVSEPPTIKRGIPAETSDSSSSLDSLQSVSSSPDTLSEETLTTRAMLFAKKKELEHQLLQQQELRQGLRNQLQLLVRHKHLRQQLQQQELLQQQLQQQLQKQQLQDERRRQQQRHRQLQRQRQQRQQRLQQHQRELQKQLKQLDEEQQQLRQKLQQHEQLSQRIKRQLRPQRQQQWQGQQQWQRAQRWKRV